MRAFERMASRGVVFTAVALLGLLNATARAQSPDLSLLFARLDTTGDGRLSKQEFAGLAALGQGRFKNQPAVFERLFDQLDLDDSGTLSVDEFKRLAGMRPGAPAATPLPSTAPPAGESEALWPSAIDPEIHQAEALMTYQTPRGEIVLEHLDRKTGRADARQERVVLDTGAANLRQTFNGPEFGYDSSGWSVYYTKPDRGALQIWRARFSDGQPEAAPVFHDAQHRQSVLVNKHASSASTRLIYLKGDLRDGAFHWADTASPERETRIVRALGVDSPRWIEETPMLVYPDPEAGSGAQVKLLDTSTGNMNQVSTDQGTKSFAYGWKSPEFGGEILVLALVDQQAIGIWRQTAAGRWERIQTISPPAQSRYQLFGSPEPVVVAGRSYISAVLKSEGGTARFQDSEVWLFGVDSPGAEPFAARVDAAGAVRTRSDPETLVAGNTVHVYYNILGADTGYRIGHAIATPSVSKDYAAEIERRPLEISTVADLALHDARRKKDLHVRINYPREGGPYPLVLFSHGAWGSKDGHVMLTELWASHGYVTIQPDHSDSRNEGVRVGDPTVFRDWPSRPADLALILDSLSAIETMSPALQGKIDRQRIGVSGHSYGANTAQLFGGAQTYFGGQQRSYADPRVAAVALLSGQGPGEMLTEQSWSEFARPLLVMTGSRDGPTRTGQPAEWRKLPYELSPPGGKYLLWVEGMDHGFGGVSGLKDGLYEFQSNPDHILFTKMVTLAFWDAHLKRDQRAEAWLESGRLASSSHGIATIEHK